MSRILFSQLSYQITGLCFKIQNDMGRFCSERQYSDAMELALKQKQIPYYREFELNVGGIKGNRVDFLINGQIIVDFKAKKFITKEDYDQMQRYLQCGKLELGLIVNFRNTYLKPKRILNTKIYSEHSDV